jgi:hypothetical protein
MKIVKDLNDVVLFAGEDLELTNEGLLGMGYAVPFCTPATHVIESVDSIPADYSGGYYSHTSGGGWIRTSLGAKAEEDKNNLVKKQEEDNANLEREDKIKSGMPYTFPDGIDGVVDIHTDRDIINITGIGVAALALQLLGDSATKLVYRDEANVNHEMTALETIQFGLAFVQWYSDKYKDSWAKKDVL